MTADRDIAVVLTPRDRYSTLPRALDDVLAHTAGPYHLVVVLGACPEPIRTRVTGVAARHQQVDVVALDRLVHPAEGRNLGLAHTAARRVAFVQHDVQVQPGWLSSLLACAEATGAAVVAPLVLESPRRVHVAACHLTKRVVNGRTEIDKDLHYFRWPLHRVPALSAETVSYAEPHAFLMDRRQISDAAPFDEDATDELDMGLEFERRGLRVAFEPAARVLYPPPPPISALDVPQFRLHWDPQEADRSLTRLEQKWNVAVHPRERRGYVGFYRRAYELVPSVLARHPTPALMRLNDWRGAAVVGLRVLRFHVGLRVRRKRR